MTESQIRFDDGSAYERMMGVWSRLAGDVFIEWLFIDHHLAAGDSLFGLWVRDAIDKAGKGGERPPRPTERRTTMTTTELRANQKSSA